MVKTINPNVWILGSIWGDARPRLTGDGFGGAMNYRMAWTALGFVGSGWIRRGLAFGFMSLMPSWTAGPFGRWWRKPSVGTPPAGESLPSQPAR